MADVSSGPVADTPPSIEKNPPSNDETPDDLPQVSNNDGIKSDDKAEGGDEAASDPDMYRYIKEELFTSEIYKVEIRNLPKFTGFNDMKKFLARHSLNPHKVKLFGKQTFAFVTFKNEEDRDKAMKMVHGMNWKGQVLSVRLAKPKEDPILRKRKQEEGEVVGGQPPSKRTERDEEEEPFSVQIANVVTPLWNVPYEEQLKMKEQETEYRNKCEFLISMGADGEDKTIGFRLGKYKGGSCAVVGPGDTSHVSAEAKSVVSAFQKFIRTTPYSVYSPETYDGHWKQLTVRTTRTKQAMAVAFFNPQKLDAEEVDALKSSMKKFFTEGEGKDSGVTSLYFVREGQRTSPNLEDLPCELVAGEDCIHEELLGLKFRISPHSFFQVNTGAAEVLYSAVGEWAQLDQDSTVLDVCCGTGTIGISLAKRVKKVIGIEMCQEAVEDAKVNAKSNGLTNVEFHCGKAEDVFPNILKSLVSPNVTAIVDPPRAGLHPKVILAIRRAAHVKRLVYVACNAKAAMNNFIDLCRAPSKRVHGAPFRPVRAMAVDLFPQTIHVEMLLLLERVDYDSQPQQTSKQ
ncbi:tRNA (uracil-5-)-methyltransferase A [Liparis tanakae]|uniref:tRNA (uracil(54)-C(5))-methyltransferase n=1 Tax=Liparis tanakae TaxID=230148 RepID=A0A4Z2IE57_9TELE|nr:tRNA (uracil-5-)-methyltransferase A [Liparis tanakae]